MKTNLLRGAVLAAVLVLAGVAVAQRPVEDIDAHRHPHLAAAQHHIGAAWQEAETARTDNRYDLGGHGAAARRLPRRRERADRTVVGRDQGPAE